MKAAIEEDEQPEDAHDQSNDEAAGEAAAERVTGHCPGCRKPFPKRLKRLRKGVTPNNPNCSACFEPLVAGEIADTNCDCSSFVCVPCFKKWQAACKQEARKQEISTEISCLRCDRSFHVSCVLKELDIDESLREEWLNAYGQTWKCKACCKKPRIA